MICLNLSEPLFNIVCFFNILRKQLHQLLKYLILRTEELDLQFRLT